MLTAGLALGRTEDALRWLGRCVDAPGTDAFELDATIREPEVRAARSGSVSHSPCPSAAEERATAAGVHRGPSQRPHAADVFHSGRPDAGL